MFLYAFGCLLLSLHTLHLNLFCCLSASIIILLCFRFRVCVYYGFVFVSSCLLSFMFFIVFQPSCHCSASLCLCYPPFCCCIICGSCLPAYLCLLLITTLISPFFIFVNFYTYWYDLLCDLFVGHDLCGCSSRTHCVCLIRICFDLGLLLV